jgi:glycosyltransferase involved in cell wall biosynthesis
VLIEAVRILRDHYRVTNVQVRLVGDALMGVEVDQQYAQKLRNHVDQYDLQDRVCFFGAVPHTHVLTEYQQADVFVNLSDTDSLDKAVLEAMSCGVPVITSNAAFDDVLKPHAALCLVSKDDPAALAHRLHETLSMSRQQRRTIGQQLRTLVVDHHSLKQLAQRLVYEVLRGTVDSFQNTRGYTEYS